MSSFVTRTSITTVDCKANMNAAKDGDSGNTDLREVRITELILSNVMGCVYIPKIQRPIVVSR